MSLDWNATHIHEWEKLADDDDEWTKTAYLAYELMRCGINSITDDNVYEVWARVQIMQGIHGPMLHNGVEPIPYTFADIQRRIGYSTNVTTEPRSKWLSSIYNELLKDIESIYKKETINA